MFFRQKKSGSRVYLQVVENRWEDGRSKQRVIATLGRLDDLQDSGQLEGLLRSGAKFCESVMLLAAHRRGETTQTRTRPVGPGMIFERLWQETGCGKVIEQLLRGRRFEFPVVCRRTQAMCRTVQFLVSLKRRSCRKRNLPN